MEQVINNRANPVGFSTIMNKVNQGLANGTFSQETIALAKESIANMLGKATGITTSLALAGYPLEAPSKKVYPVLSPLVNSISRIPVGQLSVGQQTGGAIHYKRITAINSAGLWPFVSEGGRNTKITYASDDKFASFKTLGMEDAVTQEAVWQGLSYEDLRAYSALATLQALKVVQEWGYLGGNGSTALGTPTGLTYSTTQLATAKGSLSNGTTYYYAVSALTAQGVLQAAKGNNGTVDSAGETTAATGSHATAAGGNAGDTSITLNWTTVQGAWAYNVYVGTGAGTRYYIATVYTNAYDIKATGTSTNVPNTADQTKGANDYDGFISQIETPGGTAAGYYESLDNAKLSSDGAEGIAEIETMLKYQWDTNRVSPDVILLNSQEMQSIKKTMLNAGANSLARWMIPGDSQQPAQNLMAGARVNVYYNQYTDQVIPMRVHPYLPAGKIFAPCMHLPEWFPANEVPDAIVTAVLEEYADYQFAFTSRQYEHGVYVNEVPIMYVPAFSSVITNIAAA